MITKELILAIVDHMWHADQDWLSENAGCVCCCEEHTSLFCPARYWGGCRSKICHYLQEIAAQLGKTPQEIKEQLWEKEQNNDPQRIL